MADGSGQTARVSRGLSPRVRRARVLARTSAGVAIALPIVEESLGGGAEEVDLAAGGQHEEAVVEQGLPGLAPTRHGAEWLAGRPDVGDALGDERLDFRGIGLARPADAARKIG